MAFTHQQREDFLAFLRSVDKTVASKLPPGEAGDFFSVLVDYTVEDSSFEFKIALLFYKMPEKLEELKESIKNISMVRQTMNDESSANAEEARDLTLAFFNERIDEYLELSYYEELAEETELSILEKKRRHDRKVERRRLEKELQELQDERQVIFEAEKEERKRRKDAKKEVETVIQLERQQEYEIGLVERKERRKHVDKAIQQLQQKLQSQHESETEERKAARVEKLKVQQDRQKVQQEEQEKQAMLRQREKLEEEKEMKQRQAELHHERERQGEERKTRKEQELIDRAKAVKALQEEQMRERERRRLSQSFLAPPIIDIRGGGDD